jgi:hypothetical protein
MTKSLIVDVVAKDPILTTSKSITNLTLEGVDSADCFLLLLKANRVSLMLHSEFNVNHLQLADVFSPLLLNSLLLHIDLSPMTHNRYDFDDSQHDHDIMHMRYGPSLILSSTLVVSITQKVDPSRAQIFVSFYFIGGFLCLPFISSQALPAFILVSLEDRFGIAIGRVCFASCSALPCLRIPFLTLGNLTG